MIKNVCWNPGIKSPEKKIPVENNNLVNSYLYKYMYKYCWNIIWILYYENHTHCNKNKIIKKVI